MSVEIVTFGCRLNNYESNIIKQKANAAGIENTIFLNSCAVTSEAERQLRQEIRKIKKNNQDKKIIVTGCAAQINPELYKKFPGVDGVIGNNEKLQDETYIKLANDSSFSAVADIMEKVEAENVFAEEVEGKSRGFLQVQTGCNHRCTFCIIPYGRGNSRSTPFGAIFNQAQFLVNQGYNELVITGVDITDYGLDIPGKPSLGQLVKRLLKAIPELPRLRLSSIDVAEIDNDLMDVIGNEPRLMPHLHLSLQSGDNMILKRMKRRHSREQVIEFCKKVLNLRPEIAFGADIIAGFPTETDEMFNNTVELLHEVQKIVHLHIFPYSERIGTPAARMPQVDKNIRKRRAGVLRQIGKELLYKHMNGQIGGKISVIVEKNGLCRAEDFCQVQITNYENMKVLQGKILDCVVKNISDDNMFCEIIL